MTKQAVVEIWHNDGDQVFAFRRGDLLFFFNFKPCSSYCDYGFMVERHLSYSSRRTVKTR